MWQIARTPCPERISSGSVTCIPVKGSCCRRCLRNNNAPQLREESRRENFGENNYHGGGGGDDGLVVADAAVAAAVSRLFPILMTAVNGGTPFPSLSLVTYSSRSLDTEESRKSEE